RGPRRDYRRERWRGRTAPPHRGWPRARGRRRRHRRRAPPPRRWSGQSRSDPGAWGSVTWAAGPRQDAARRRGRFVLAFRLLRLVPTLSWSGLLAFGLVPRVPTIHLTAGSGARGTLDPRDKPEDDSGRSQLGRQRLGDRVTWRRFSSVTARGRPAGRGRRCGRCW